MFRIIFCNFFLCLLVKRSVAAFDCPPQETCNSSDAYRRMDGQCNNLQHPLWGSTGRPFRRSLRPVYDDGLGTPRGSNGSLKLPSPRNVSIGMTNSTLSANSKLLSLMAMQFGQFLAHDLSLTPHYTLEIKCCTPNFTFLPKSNLDPQCMPLDVRNDHFYKRFQVECLSLARSKEASSQCGVQETREQVNIHTAWIDLSQVYGNSVEENKKLRTLTKGQLAVDARVEDPPGKNCTNTKQSCPFSQLPMNIINGTEKLLSGDPTRVDENPALVSLHALFSRFHNDIAEMLALKYANLTDEDIFQEARRYVIAVFQHIVYNEYLPTVLDNDTITAYLLSPNVPHSYNSTIDATTPNEFSTGAFRFGHTQIQNIFLLLERKIHLKESYFIPNITYQPDQHPSQFCEGLASEIGNDIDHFVVEAATNYLYAEPPFDFGSDLFATNTMRGRDHGLAPFNAWRKFCGLREYSSFQDLKNSNDMHATAVDAFENLYPSVDELDLYVAGLAEKPKNGVGVGPTFQCLIAQHFKNLKFGDRFFYTSIELPKKFTDEELSAIKNITLASLICRYTSAKSITKFVMLKKNLEGRLPLIPTSNPTMFCTNEVEGTLSGLVSLLYYLLSLFI